MIQEAKFSIVSVSPLLMHSIQLANPLNKWTKQIKQITSKRKKTDADLEELARLEFMGGLYVDEDLEPCIPGINVEGMMVSGAKKQRLGEQFKAGLFCEGNWKLHYDGPKNPEKMWESGKFHDIRGVSVGKATVMRCRPYFPKWALDFTVQFYDDVLSISQIGDALDLSGLYCGLCDYTPRFGRFMQKSKLKEKAG